MLAAAAFRPARSDVCNDPSYSRLPLCRPLVLPPGGALRSLALCDFQLRDNLFLDVVQTVLAEEYLVADEESRRTEGAAIDRVAGVLDQLLLDVVLLRARDETVDVHAGRNERLAEDLRIVHLLRLDPHVMIGRTEIGLEHALELRGDGAPHQRQG